VGNTATMTDGRTRDLARQVAWHAAASPDQIEMKRLRVMRRSWLRGAEEASNPGVFRKAARIIRRWMRPVRRRMKKSRT
jgi:hypothetical protein